MHTSQPATSQPQVISASEVCKAVVLKIANHLFALPTTAILKIVPAAAANASEQHLTLWNGVPLILLDLHQLLEGTTADRPTTLETQWIGHNPRRNYTIITRTSTLDRCAIGVDELPVFQDIPLAKVQALSPYHYRLTGSIAKHRVTLPYQGVPSTILLLDLQHALYRWQIRQNSIG